MAAEAATAAADTGNSPRIIQQSPGNGWQQMLSAVFHCAEAFPCSWKQSNPAARYRPRGIKSYRVRENGAAQIAPSRPTLLAYSFLISRYRPLITDHCLLGEGSGGGRPFHFRGTAIERAPFLPTARTAKK